MKSEKTWSDADLRQAADLAASAMLQAMPSPAACEYTFTPAFQEKMDALLHRARAARRRKRTWTRVAAAIAAVLVSLGTWLTVDAEAREVVYRWFSERFGSTVVYFFPNKETAKSPGLYEPSWIPDGFIEVKRNCMKDHGTIFYKSESTNQEFLFHYETVGDTTYVEYGDVSEEPEVVSVQGFRGEYYPAGSGSIWNYLTWFDESTGILFSVDGKMEKAVMLHIAESVKLAETPKS